METPLIIYLVQYNHDTADLSWCEDPAPEQGMDAKDAISYVRADHVLATLQEYKKVTDLINELTPECQHEWETHQGKMFFCEKCTKCGEERN